ncbi:MAG: UDP-N-acetylmuramoyl-L-alanine--D-glutamate ligase [Salaquimonas sp.]
MIAAHTAKGKRIALFGLGGSGLATARSLAAGGAELFCFDDNPQSVENAAKEGLQTADLRQLDFSTLDELLLAPGVPLTHPKPHWTVELAKAAGIPIIGDVEIFARERQAKAPDSAFIAITGTNGKSTTTALIAHVLKHAGRDVQLGGNIGTAVLSLDEPADNKIFVVECSSYQIDLAPSLKPKVGLLLNLAPDHLDRHGNMFNYANIKKRLVSASELAVLGNDDEFTIGIAQDLTRDAKRVICVSGDHKLSDGIYLSGTQLIEASSGKQTVLFDLADAPALRGNHNGQNAAAAWAACSDCGLSAEEIGAGFAAFPGLVHRMEQIGSVGKTLFVNDSKGTNADAAAKALSSFERIYWIAGGLPKEGGIESLRQYFPKIAKAYLIGEAAPEFAATLSANVSFEISETMDRAVIQAAKDAAQDSHDQPVVLLSPACASFDQYKNFEVRGDAFRNLVIAQERFISLKETMQ